MVKLKSSPHKLQMLSSLKFVLGVKYSSDRLLRPFMDTWHLLEKVRRKNNPRLPCLFVHTSTTSRCEETVLMATLSMEADVLMAPKNAHLSLLASRWETLHLERLSIMTLDCKF
mmetsp:Transcript_20361/g.37042  ORF Transcript_20361/g.37042 Transcript_20361/m.37042 type:complete len:114 (-) Transcript_20361:16-357(-)